MKRRLFLAITCALLLSLSFPPLRLGFLSYVALVPFWLLLDELTIRESFRWGYLVGLFISIGTIYWIFWPTPAGAVAAILFHPVYYALFAVCYSFLKKQWGQVALFATPFLWVAFEYLKSLGQLGFPWVTLGNTQSYYTSLIQYATFTGVYGVSFWVVCLNVLVYLMVQNQRTRATMIRYAGIFVLFFLVPYFYGRKVIPQKLPETKSVKVAIIQGNIDPYLKWNKQLLEMNFKVYERLSRQVGHKNVDLIIWPETATPTYLLHDRRNLARVQQLVRELDAPILTGTPDYIRLARRQYKTFNSLVLIDGTLRPYQKYAKIHLVPFGERVPYEDSIPILKKLLSSLEMGEGNFSPGREITVFKLFKKNSNNSASDGYVYYLGGVICFESIFPGLVAKFVRKGAQLLTVVTNDGWFGRTGAPYQHAQMAVFRAIENRISIARSANTGVSMTIDPYGRVRKQTRIFEEATLIDTLPLRRETTFFTRHGNFFAQMVLGISLALLLGTLLDMRFRK